MKMQPEVVAQLKALLPESLVPSAWIAGGYAHDPEKAGDIDVWVVGVQDMDAAERAVRKYLGLDPEVHIEGRKSGTNHPEYNQHPNGFRVTHNGEIYEGYTMRKLQILLTIQPDIDALLKQFDITTHKIAYPLIAPATFKAGEGYFPIGAQPRVTNWHTPLSTLHRLMKISERYGFEPHPEDVAKLQALVDKDFTEEVPFEVSRPHQW